MRHLTQNNTKCIALTQNKTDHGSAIALYPSHTERPNPFKTTQDQSRHHRRPRKSCHGQDPTWIHRILVVPTTKRAPPAVSISQRAPPPLPPQNPKPHMTARGTQPRHQPPNRQALVWCGRSPGEKRQISHRKKRREENCPYSYE